MERREEERLMEKIKKASKEAKVVLKKDEIEFLIGECRRHAPLIEEEEIIKGFIFYKKNLKKENF